jgi:hypothetical protein
MNSDSTVSISTWTSYFSLLLTQGEEINVSSILGKIRKYQVWWNRPVISVWGKLKLEDFKFNANQDCIRKPYTNNTYIHTYIHT